MFHRNKDKLCMFHFWNHGIMYGHVSVLDLYWCYHHGTINEIYLKTDFSITKNGVKLLVTASLITDSRLCLTSQTTYWLIIYCCIICQSTMRWPVYFCLLSRPPCGNEMFERRYQSPRCYRDMTISAWAESDRGPWILHSSCMFPLFNKIEWNAEIANHGYDRAGVIHCLHILAKFILDFFFERIKGT